MQLLRWLSKAPTETANLALPALKQLFAALLRAIGGRIGCRRQGGTRAARILQDGCDMSIAAIMHLCFGAKQADFTRPAPQLCKRAHICSRPSPLSQFPIRDPVKGGPSWTRGRLLTIAYPFQLAPPVLLSR